MTAHATGEGEGFKGACHFVMANIATTLLLYNALAWTTRPAGQGKRHLIYNMAVYAALICFETKHTYDHWTCRDSI
jgi:hypothetical protein